MVSTDDCRCNTSSPVLLSGTHICSGYQWKALVIAVGENSIMGKINKILNHDEDYILSTKDLLGSIEDKYIQFGVFCAIIAMVSIILRILVNHLIGGSYSAKNSNLDLEQYFNFIMLIFTILIIPHLWTPSFFYLILFSKTLVDIKKDQILVRKFTWFEKLRKINCILTDKTGTLTRNGLYVTNVWWGEDIPIDSNQAQLSAETIIKHDQTRNLLIEGLTWNSLKEIGEGNQTNDAYLRLQLSQNIKLKIINKSNN